jgi:hypothetical protein
MLCADNVPLLLLPCVCVSQGKTFQCALAYKKLGIAPIVMSAGELESGNAGEPAKLIRQRYREASDVIKKVRAGARVYDMGLYGFLTGHGVGNLGFSSRAGRILTPGVRGVVGVAGAGWQVLQVVATADKLAWHTNSCHDATDVAAMMQPWLRLLHISCTAVHMWVCNKHRTSHSDHQTNMRPWRGTCTNLLVLPAATALLLSPQGKMCSLFINDLDAGAGRMGESTQYTVNNQMVNATLMNIADNPTNVQLPGVYKNETIPRVPIVCTGEDGGVLLL